MLQRIQTIAFNTFRESVRARILLGLAGVAFAVSLLSLVIGSFTLQNAVRVVSDLGTASISLFSIAVAVVIGATSLHRELEQKTIFPILARPIGRSEYLVGKYLGTLLVIFVFIAADAGLVMSLAALMGGRDPALVIGAFGVLSVGLALAAWRWVPLRTYGIVPWSVLLLVAGMWLSSNVPDERRLVLFASALCLFEVMIVAAFATLYSSFSTPFLSALLTLGLWIVGRQADALDRFPKKFFGELVSDGAKVLAKVVPNLQVYVPPRPLLTGENPDVHGPTYLALAAGNSLAWTVVLLSVAALVFKRRDFL
jgi:Cu-processing system permease protein